MLNKIKNISALLIFVTQVVLYAQNSISGSVEYYITLGSGIDKTKLSPLSERDKAKEDSVYKATNEKISNKGFVNLTQTLVFNGTEAGTYIDVEAKKVLKFYQNHFTKTLLGIETTMSGRYLVIDTLITISWQLSKNSKKIQNIECFSAQVEYRGRIWTAWYAPSIPISSGPWKLYGLPGMILEAEDIKKCIHFKCLSVSIPPPSDSKIEIPKIKDDKKQNNPVTVKEFAVIYQNSIINAEKMSFNNENGISSHSNFMVNNIEIFDFEKKLFLKRCQQKLSDIPKK